MGAGRSIVGVADIMLSANYVLLQLEGLIVREDLAVYQKSYELFCCCGMELITGG